MTRSDVTCFGMPEPEDLRSTNQSFPKAMAPDGTGLRLPRALLRAPLVSQRAILTDPIEAEWCLGPLPSCCQAARPHTNETATQALSAASLRLETACATHAQSKFPSPSIIIPISRCSKFPFRSAKLSAPPDRVPKSEPSSRVTASTASAASRADMRSTMPGRPRCAAPAAHEAEPPRSGHHRSRCAAIRFR